MKRIELINPFQPCSLFKQTFSPQQRWKKHLNIVKGSEDHVSIIIEKLPSSRIKSKKPYILIAIQRNCTIYQLRQTIRKIFDISEIDSLTLFCNRLIPHFKQRICNLEVYAEPDGFIYFYIGSQQSFG